MTKSAHRFEQRNGELTFFMFDLGLFQGCVLSCILFNCVFQLLLDLVEDLLVNEGYQFKASDIIIFLEAFADDLSIATSTPEANQRAINAVVKWLKWALMMANPKKCIAMGMKRFDPRFVPKCTTNANCVRERDRAKFAW